jgi:hypothetical protein
MAKKLLRNYCHGQYRFLMREERCEDEFNTTLQSDLLDLKFDDAQEEDFELLESIRYKFKERKYE